MTSCTSMHPGSASGSLSARSTINSGSDEASSRGNRSSGCMTAIAAMYILHRGDGERIELSTARAGTIATGPWEHAEAMQGYPDSGRGA